MHTSGYVMIRINGKNVPLHRHLMSEKIGRPLEKHEQVHHKNGNRSDNRMENLELWSCSQPKGGRTEDLVAWATSMLAAYAPERLSSDAMSNAKPLSETGTMGRYPRS